MTNHQCSECGPHGNRGLVTLLFSVVQCTLCGQCEKCNARKQGGSCVFCDSVLSQESIKDTLDATLNERMSPIGHSKELRAALAMAKQPPCDVFGKCRGSSCDDAEPQFYGEALRSVNEYLPRGEISDFRLYKLAVPQLSAETERKLRELFDNYKGTLYYQRFLVLDSDDDDDDRTGK